jgi:hypothetical protein
MFLVSGFRSPPSPHFLKLDSEELKHMFQQCCKSRKAWLWAMARTHSDSCFQNSNAPQIYTFDGLSKTNAPFIQEKVLAFFKKKKSARCSMSRSVMKNAILLSQFNGKRVAPQHEQSEHS